MQKIRLVLCDIDDTLVHKELLLKESTVSVIRELRRRNVFFSLATGRMPYRAAAFARQAELSVPYIANNGSILYDQILEKNLYCNKVHAEMFRNILSGYMKENPQFTVIFSYDDRERPVCQTKWILDRAHKYKGYDEPLGDTDQTWNQDVHKVYIVDDQRTGIIGEIAEIFEGMNGDFSYYQYQQYSMEIVAAGCSKASGLKRLLDYLHLSRSQAMVIGDHTNDKEIIKMAGLGVAVANAQEELKEIADYVCSAERAEGVEEAIRRFVLR